MNTCPTCSNARQRNKYRSLLLFLLLWASVQPPLLACPQEPVEQREGYSVHIVPVPVSHCDTATGFLLIPNASAPCPAVLVLHDHGARFTIGKEKMVCPVVREDRDTLIRQEAEQWVAKFYDNMFVSDSLAKAGYVVLCIDAVYWGERRLKADTLEQLGTKSLNKYLKNYQPAYYQAHLSQYGEPWFETILKDDRACIDYLCGLPCVDASRMAVFGFSMGAFRAWQLAAEDTRVRACAAAHWMTTRADHLGPTLQPAGDNSSAYAMYRPNSRDDYPNTAARIAPRPFLLLYGTADPLFTSDSVQTAIQTITNTYQAAASDSLFLPQGMPYKHFFSTRHLNSLLRFLSEHLQARVL